MWLYLISSSPLSTSSPVIKFFSASLCHEPRRWVARRGSGRELEDRGGTTSWCGGGGASRLWSMDSEDKALGSSRLSYQPGMGKAEKERRQGRELRGTGEHSGSGLEK